MRGKVGVKWIPFPLWRIFLWKRHRERKIEQWFLHRLRVIRISQTCILCIFVSTYIYSNTDYGHVRVCVCICIQVTTSDLKVHFAMERGLTSQLFVKNQHSSLSRREQSKEYFIKYSCGFWRKQTRFIFTRLQFQNIMYDIKASSLF